MPNASSECNILSPSLCRVVNADSYALLLAFWASLQLTWVTMLLFVQFVQVARAMTTYENMFGVDGRDAASSLTSAFTSTGMPLDAGSVTSHPPSGAAALPDAAGDGHGHGHHGHGHGHSHGSGGFIKTWSRLLGVDAFIETATGRGAAVGSGAGAKRRRRGNPYSHGVVTNCKDFWCDPAPVFGKRDNGTAALDGVVVNYASLYERPMEVDRPRSSAVGVEARRTGGYEAVPASEEA
jgi:palmitoyltransferase ZDHHC13/17